MNFWMTQRYNVKLLTIKVWYIKQVKWKLSKAFENISSGNFNKNSIDVITAYAAAATAYGNGQRYGAITNLTIAEFEMREETYKDECVNTMCPSQNCNTRTGLPEDTDLLQYYYDNIRVKLTPVASCQDFLFLIWGGEQYDQVYRHIKESLGTDSMVPPQPGLYRILISTEARHHLDEMKRRKTVKNLSHSTHTSEMYYEYLNADDATEAHTRTH